MAYLYFFAVVLTSITGSGVPVHCYKVEEIACRVQDGNLLTLAPHFHRRTHICVSLVAFMVFKNLQGKQSLTEKNLPYHTQ